MTPISTCGPRDRGHGRYYLLILLLIAAVYAPSMGNSFLTGDDYSFIISNPHIALPAKELPSIFTKSLSEFAEGSHRGPYYRPILFLFIWSTHAISGPNAACFHSVNIILHITSAIFLYRIGLILLQNNRLAALFSAALFAVHPVHNQTVGAVGLGDALYGSFLIISLFFSLTRKRFLSLAFYSGALLAKEASVMLVPLLSVFFVREKGLRKGIVEIMPTAALAIIYLAVRSVIVTSVPGDLSPQPFLTQILTAAVAAADYLRLLVIPYPLSPFYPERWFSSLLDPRVLSSLLTLALFAFAYLRLKDSPAMSFLMAAIFITLLPVLLKVNAFPYGSEQAFMAERFLYVPSMFFALLVSAALAEFLGKKSRIQFIAGGLTIILAMSAQTVATNRTWADSITLYRRILNETPDASFARFNLGLAYQVKGLYDEAITEYTEYVRLRPSHADTHLKIGQILFFNKGLVDDAIRHFEAAALLDPSDAQAHVYWAMACEAKGQSELAYQHYATARQLNPKSF
ncbi:MAG: tetratricopeptide repeat protein [Nitrospirae bacterium]|nr:tetratricopeptide repeat protein [Nitrospirota bacterium]